MEYIGKIENDKILTDASGIVIFGAGKNLGCLIEKLKRMGLRNRILCICDNDTSQHGKKIEEIEVVSPTYAFSIYSKAIYIVYNRFCVEICRQLIKEDIKRVHLIRG